MLKFQQIGPGSAQTIGSYDPKLLVRKYGFIAILDALGTKNATYEEIDAFLSAHKFVKDIVNLQLSVLIKSITIKDIDIDSIRLDFFLFQDTVIIALDVGSEENLDRLMVYFGTLIQYYMSASFIFHIRFRGAMAYGEYYQYENEFYFGPAVNDAGAWFEEAEFIGVITTPKFANYLNDIEAKIVHGHISNNEIILEKFKEIYLRSNIPTKKGMLTTWSINWPIALAYQGTLPEDNINQKLNAKEVYYTLLKRFDVPKGTEAKYNNTTGYIESIFKKFPKALEILRPGTENYPDLFNE